MNNPYLDKRKAIAGEFFMNDSRMKNRSRKAYKKIQIWKAASGCHEVDKQYQSQIENLIRFSFFEQVSSAEVLISENYFDRSLDN